MNLRVNRQTTKQVKIFVLVEFSLVEDPEGMFSFVVADCLHVKEQIFVIVECFLEAFMALL